MKLSAIVDNCRRCVQSFVCGLLQLVVAGVFGLLQKAMDFRGPRALLGKLRSRQGSVVRARVLWPRKSVLITPSSPEDFLLWSQPEPSSLDVLLEQNVSLYCVTPDCVVFVRTPPGINLYGSEISPFLYLAQFYNAQEVYVTSHHWFHVLTSEIAEECRVPVTCLSNTGRCGSTMLCQIMESVPGTVSVSEPDAFENIVFMLNSGLITPDEALALVRSAMLILVYHVKAQAGALSSSEDGPRHIFIKFRAECTSLVRQIVQACPQIRQVFMYRHLPQMICSCRQLVQRQLPTLTRLIDSDTVAAITPQIRLKFFNYFFFGDKGPFADLVHRLSLFGITAAKVCSQIKLVQSLQDEGFSIPALLYEDILEDPASTVGSLFDHLRLPREHVHSALSAMSRHSQRGVPAFVDSDQAAGHRMTARDRQELDTVLSRLQLPKTDESIVFAQKICR